MVSAPYFFASCAHRDGGGNLHSSHTCTHQGWGSLVLHFSLTHAYAQLFCPPLIPCTQLYVASFCISPSCSIHTHVLTLTQILCKGPVEWQAAAIPFLGQGRSASAIKHMQMFFSSKIPHLCYRSRLSS